MTDNTLDPRIVFKFKQLTSLFENGDTGQHYDYTEILHDGRGVTCGIIGFTTATGDALAVIKHYHDLRPNNNPLAGFIPALEILAAKESGDVGTITGYCNAWKKAATDPLFRKAQDDMCNQIYLVPALKHCASLGLNEPLSKALIYDTIVQHGEGDDPDSLGAIITRTNLAARGTPLTGVLEDSWISVFLDERQKDLEHAYEPETRAVWAESVSRVKVFRQLWKDKHESLSGTIAINTAGVEGTIQA